MRSEPSGSHSREYPMPFEPALTSLAGWRTPRRSRLSRGRAKVRPFPLPAASLGGVLVQPTSAVVTACCTWTSWSRCVADEPLFGPVGLTALIEPGTQSTFYGMLGAV
jgi:hypothetical protein